MHSSHSSLLPAGVLLALPPSTPPRHSVLRDAALLLSAKGSSHTPCLISYEPLRADTTSLLPSGRAQHTLIASCCSFFAEWLSSVYKQQWFAMLRVEQDNDTGWVHCRVSSAYSSQRKPHSDKNHTACFWVVPNGCTSCPPGVQHSPMGGGGVGQHSERSSVSHRDVTHHTDTDPCLLSPNGSRLGGLLGRFGLLVQPLHTWSRSSVCCNSWTPKCPHLERFWRRPWRGGMAMSCDPHRQLLRIPSHAGALCCCSVCSQAPRNQQGGAGGEQHEVRAEAGAGRRCKCAPNTWGRGGRAARDGAEPHGWACTVTPGAPWLFPAVLLALDRLQLRLRPPDHLHQSLHHLQAEHAQPAMQRLRQPAAPAQHRLQVPPRA